MLPIGAASLPPTTDFGPIFPANTDSNLFPIILTARMSAKAITDLLTSVGIPEILDDPDALATMSDEAMETLLQARALAADAVEQHPTDAALIDLLYTAHMSVTSARYLHAVLAAGTPIEAPTPADLVRLWSGDPLQQVEKGALRDMVAPTETIDTLVKAGLPLEAEPDITFLEAPKRFTSVIAIEAGEDDYAAYFDPYWMIGATVNDDVIAIDERADGVVVVLDQDWGFFAMQYVNASVAHLLLTMQAYADMLDAVDPQELAEHFPNIVIPEEHRRTFVAKIEAIDPGAMTEGAFWYEEIALMAT